MRLLKCATCALLIALSPLAAEAHWSGHHHHRRQWSSGRVFNDPLGLFIPTSRASCESGLTDARGRLRRCAAARDAFERENPCPSTGLARGPCPGYVVDHIIPLKRGGADDPSNMQWQTIADAKAKDRIE